MWVKFYLVLSPSIFIRSKNVVLELYCLSNFLNSDDHPDHRMMPRDGAVEEAACQKLRDNWLSQKSDTSSSMTFVTMAFIVSDCLVLWCFCSLSITVLVRWISYMSSLFRLCHVLASPFSLWSLLRNMEAPSADDSPPEAPSAVDSPPEAPSTDDSSIPLVNKSVGQCYAIWWSASF